MNTDEGWCICAEVTAQTGAVLTHEQTMAVCRLSRDLLDTRLAAVRALADEWAADPDGLPRADGCARRLRAVVDGQDQP